MYAIGQHFEKVYPPEAAEWCNANNAMLVSDNDGFTIQEVPAPTEEEQAEMRRQEIFMKLDRIDRASSRSLRAILTAQAAGTEPAQADVQMLATYEAEAVALREELKALGNA